MMLPLAPDSRPWVPLLPPGLPHSSVSPPGPVLYLKVFRVDISPGSCQQDGAFMQNTNVSPPPDGQMAPKCPPWADGF